MVERMKQKRNEGGFTLIELLIVIIILAILAAIVVFAVGTTGQNAAVAACVSDAKGVQTALESYKAETANNLYPPADKWADLTTPQPGPNGSNVGPWLKSVPSSTHYAINFDGLGNVSADAAGTASYSGADDIDFVNQQTNAPTTAEAVCTAHAK